MCEKDLENLKNWKPDSGLHPGSVKGLSPQGKKDLETMGQRFKKEFPQLFNTCESQNCKVSNLEEHKVYKSFDWFYKDFLIIVFFFFFFLFVKTSNFLETLEYTSKK